MHHENWRVLLSYSATILFVLKLLTIEMDEIAQNSGVVVCARVHACMRARVHVCVCACVRARAGYLATLVAVVVSAAAVVV